MEQPPGHVIGGKGKVYRMLKSVYGTKQSPRNFGKHINAVLKELGFEQSIYDACLYMMKVGKSFVNLVLHVDDFAVFYNDESLCEKVYSNLSTKMR